MESNDFDAAVDFLDQRNRSAVLNNMLPIPLDSLREVPGYYGLSGRLRAWLVMGDRSTPDDDSKNITVSAASPASIQAIRGYSFFLPLSIQHEPDATGAKTGDYFQISEDGKALEWWKADPQKAGVLEAQFDLQPTMQQWFDRRKSDNSTIELNDADRVINFSGKKGKLRILVEGARAEMGDSGMSMDYLNGFIFIQ
jgi:hypothetical protein